MKVRKPGSGMRLLWSAVAIAAALLAFAGPVDRIGDDYAQRAFARALVTFAAARTLNGVISVAQGTEVAVEPAGVGVIFTFGQILDPINDLVERFSTVMLIATSSLGLQNLLLRITGWWGITALLIAIGAFALVTLWWPRPATVETDTAAAGDRDRPVDRLARIAIRLLLAAVFLRFAIPLLIILTTLVFDTFLAAEQEAAVQAIEAARVDIEAVNEDVAPPPVTDDSIVGRFSAWVDRSLDSLDVERRLDSLGERVSNTTEHIINLIVIFLFQTVFMPIAILWLLLEALKSLARRGVS